MKTRLALFGLLLLSLLPMACHITGDGGRSFLAIDADTTLLKPDRVVVLLRGADGTDTLFDGKLNGLDTLSRLPAEGYSGGRAVIVIQGFTGGQLTYHEERDYDGGTGKAVVEVVLNGSGPGNSTGSLDIRPDMVRLFAGGEALQMDAHPPATWQGRTLQWSTGNPEVATVSQSGLISPVGPGITYVRAKWGDSASDAASLTVVRDVPVIDAGADTIVAAGTAVAYQVKVTQEYGKVEAFAWDLDGDGAFEDSLAGASGQIYFQTTAKTYAATGEITVRFRARDGEGNQRTASKKVKVNAAAPRIDSLAAVPALISIKDSVAFSAKAVGVGGDLASFGWDFDGDGKEDLTGTAQGASAALQAGFRYPQAGVYKARLRATDAGGTPVTATVDVTVKLDRPAADAGTAVPVVPGAAVRLQGKGYDTLGRIEKREWKIGSAAFAPAADSGSVTFTAPSVPGDIVCVFRVTDDDGLTAEDSVTVTVNDSKAPAIASFLPLDTVISIGDSVPFSAKVTAADADLKSYTVDYIEGDGTVDVQGSLSGRSGEIRAGHRYPTAGQYNVILKATDAAGLTATAQARVTVLRDPPKADAGRDTAVAAGGQVNLHGRASDSLGRIAKLEWKIGGAEFRDVSKGDTSFTAPPASGTLVCVFRATDDDGNASSDTMAVTVAPSADASLAALSANGLTLNPKFSAQDTAYTAVATAQLASTRVKAEPLNAGATVTVNGNPVTPPALSDSIPLPEGATKITVVVTAEDKKTKKTYLITVTRAISKDASLSDLKVGAVSLNPTFASATTAYTATVINSVAEVAVTPTAAGPGASIKVNAAAVASGNASAPIALAVGANPITVVVTAQDGITTKTYTVTVTREAGADAGLSALAVSGATLNPVFSKATTEYASSVANSVASVTVTPTVAAAGATVKVNNATVASGTASAAIPLTPGGNTVITVAVTAQNGTTKLTYTITITRGAGSNPRLSALALGTGVTLAKTFHPDTLNYNATSPAGTASLKITPTAAEAGATITVDGAAVASGAASAALAFTYGATRHAIVVKAQDGTTTRTYTVTVWRDAPPDMVLGYASIHRPTEPRKLGSGDWFYNPAGDIDFQWSAIGKYRVIFRGLAARGNAEGIVHVTSMGGQTASFCKITDWTSAGDLSAGVACFTPSGAAVDVPISIMTMFPRAGANGHNAYVFADQASASAIYAPAPGRSWNSLGGADPNVVQRTGTGSYRVTFKGMGTPSTDLGNPMLTAHGTGNTRCAVTSWSASGSDLAVLVTCKNASGTPTDAQFNLSLLKAYTDDVYGVATARITDSTGDTRGTYSKSNGGGPISVSIPETGNYSMWVGGIGALGDPRTSTLQITPLGSASNAVCMIDSWANFDDIMVNIYCIDPSGLPVNPDINFWILK